MTLTIDEVLEIVDDDEKYVRHVNRHVLPNNARTRILEIPKSSFTASRLIYVSPIELSLSSKVLLLGGVPEHWYKAQPNLVRREPWRTRNSKNTEIMNGTTEYGINSGNIREEKKFQGPYSGGMMLNIEKLAATSERLGKTRRLSTSSGKLKRHSHNLITSRTADFCQIKASFSSQLKTSTTFLDKTVLDKDLAQDREKKLRNNSTVKDNRDFQRTGLLGKNLNPSLLSNDGILDMQQDLGHRQCLHCEQEGNEMEMNKLLCGIVTGANQTSEESTDIYVSAASESEDAKAYEKACSEASTASSLTSSACSTVPIPNVETDASRSSGIINPANNTNDMALTINNLDDHPTFRSGLIQSTLGERKRIHGNPVVFIKETVLSNCYKRLSLLKPNPEQVTFDENDEKPIESSKTLISTAGKHKLASFNGVRERMISRIRKGLSRRYDYYSSYRHPSKLGPIIMKDKILVMVKNAVTQRYPIVEFSESEPIDTWVADRWDEYLVIARLTNQDDRPIFIQFRPHKRSSRFHITSFSDRSEDDFNFGSMLDFYLDKSCITGIYSPLDKTIFIEKPDEKLSSSTLEELNDLREWNLSTLKFYIFKCSTLTSTSRWFDFFQGVTSVSAIPNRISIRVPDAEVSFTVHLEKYELEKLDRIEASAQDTLKISCLPRGYCIFRSALLRYLTITLNERLHASGYKDIVKSWESVNVNLGCDFRYYDLIKWCPAFQRISLRSLSTLFQFHVLEFRPYTHYGRKLKLSNGSTLLEPTATEGFLLRLTDYKGSDKNALGRPHLKQVYFSTNENLLFITSAIKATPPFSLEVSEYVNRQSNAEEVDLSLKGLPDVYEQNPYPLDLENHIEWLKDESNKDDISTFDYFAKKCFNRRILQIIKSESVIDMTEIEEVRQGSIMDIEFHRINYEIYSRARSDIWKTEKSLNETAKSLIFIHIKNRSTMKLLAVSPTISKQWVTRLNCHVGYWKQKHENDVMQLWGTKIRNMNNLKIDEIEEANINGRTPKWVTERGISAPSIYNINALAVVRPILHRGILHQKPKKHSLFTRYLVVLIPGFLILYHYFRRSITDYTNLSSDHVHYMTIPIEDCYVYSGTLTELDLLNRDKTFDEFNPGSHCLPRIYDDGWISSEAENSRCFTLWFGSKRILSRWHVNSQNKKDRGDITESMRNDLQNPHMIEMIRQLGITGKSMVFMARSRQERDLWVLSLQYELERLMANR